MLVSIFYFQQGKIKKLLDVRDFDSATQKSKISATPAPKHSIIILKFFYIIYEICTFKHDFAKNKFENFSKCVSSTRFNFQFKIEISAIILI